MVTTKVVDGQSRRFVHDVDVTEAATLEERYFIVIAGLLEKNLEELRGIRAALAEKSSPTRESVSGSLSGEVAARPAPQQHFDPSRKAKRP